MVLSSTCNMVAAGGCWCLSVMNSSIMFHLAQAGSLDVLVFVGEVGVQARLHTNCILLRGRPLSGELVFLHTLILIRRKACIHRRTPTLHPPNTLHLATRQNRTEYGFVYWTRHVYYASNAARDAWAPHTQTQMHGVRP